MLKGFKEFLLRGNVIDLAVAVVVGAAFTTIVNSLVTNIFNPAIGALFNAGSLDSLLIVRIPSLADPAHPAEIKFGAVIGAAIQFLIVAVVVYFVLVLPINHLKKTAFRKKEEGEPAVDADTPPTELELLKDIRDLLATGQTADGAGGAEGKHAAPPAPAQQ